MLMTLSTKLAKLRKSRVEVDGHSRAKHDRSEIDGRGMKEFEVDSGKIGDDEVGKKV